ncbi:MAG: tyrosine--tRNA ligase [Nitrosopumilus sp.]|nr:tyrosine--tRNA ligase [Nitrosopumilus sp.]MDA7942475.1 tyrosine--tRNA ligase [Nitrosopumilus sp.]
MDAESRADLIARPPAEEVVTRAELLELLGSSRAPRHYIGLEVSGFLHLGSLLVAGAKVNDFADAGCRCTIFLADWHTIINDKLGGERDRIARATRYYREAFSMICPRAEIITGTGLYEGDPSYWEGVLGVAGHMSLARAARCLTIMGRSEDEKVSLSKLLYPPMQAADMHSMDIDIAHSGTDQRKIHMLAREAFPKMGWKVPVAVHHALLPGLSGPAGGKSGKMSKSDPASGIFMHDTDEQIRKKISRAWCEAGATAGNPVLAIAAHLLRDGPLDIERPEKFGGNVTYADRSALESDYAAKRLHPGDLKGAVADALVRAVAPVRDRLGPDRVL